ncbi:uncharacterized protein G2W53_030689 [Senna tora]|uniref:Uncharacterized protein n=1 Tax=Senna tora TaxID=362788 RepID=A0A834T7X0_9FABA|nr:uncharacterized protein G2W53_030689 [Senna tora]
MTKQNLITKLIDQHLVVTTLHISLADAYAIAYQVQNINGTQFSPVLEQALRMRHNTISLQWLDLNRPKEC